MDSNKLKPGHMILVEGQPYKVVDATRRQQPRMVAKIITKLSNMLTGGMIEKTFTSGENLAKADITKVPAQYLYNDGDNYVFMEMSTLEQYEIPKAKLGTAIRFLKEGMDLSIIKFNDKPIDLELPLSMTFVVQSTEPAVKGDTVNNIMKPATLETGYEISVPMFVASGEEIIVNTETGEYKGRAK